MKTYEKYLTEGKELALAGLSQELKRVGLELSDVDSKAEAKIYKRIRKFS